ncbi:MAG: 3-oxoacyl-ACP reductase family protein [Pseudomonadota bacterium]
MNKKIALITGGSRGIGEAMVKQFSEENYFVYFTYTSNQAAAIALENNLNTHERCVQAVKVSFDQEHEMRAVFQLINNEAGQLDALVNNAGIILDQLIARMTLSEWDQVISTNLRSVFFMSQLAGELMMPQRTGCIINMTSISGIRGAIGQCNYAAAKGGIISLSKSMARELSPFNIRVNAIAPGFIETDMTKSLSIIDKKRALQTCLLKRFGKPEEIANVATFLASDKASYIQGQVIVVDGGVLL